MGLNLLIAPGRKFHIRHNASGDPAVFEIRRAVNRAGEWVLVLHDESRRFNLGLQPRAKEAKPA